MRPKRAAPGQVPDISQFLDDNKGRVDRDPDGLAYDDLRHYAYEGDGNSMGSLSSLASGALKTVQYLVVFMKFNGSHLVYRNGRWRFRFRMFIGLWSTF